MLLCTEIMELKLKSRQIISIVCMRVCIKSQAVLVADTSLLDKWPNDADAASTQELFY